MSTPNPASDGSVRVVVTLPNGFTTPATVSWGTNYTRIKPDKPLRVEPGEMGVSLGDTDDYIFEMDVCDIVSSEAIVKTLVADWLRDSGWTP